jgi:RNA polymerase sigma-70 factor (ECF subfamily)
LKEVSIHLEGIKLMSARKREHLFEQWIEEHKGVILKVVRANAADHDDQDDLFQEIAFQVWLSIPSFQERAKVSTWIYKVALNTTMVWHRAQKRHRHMREPLYLVNEEPSSGEDPSTSVEKREKLDWLYEEIRKLQTVDRSLALLYLDEFSYQEIADILGISTNNVGVKLSRLRKHLDKAFARRDK